MINNRREIHENNSHGKKLRFYPLLLLICLISIFIVIPVKGDTLSNQYCPVTTSELAEEQFFVNYQGKQIYFCCDKCRKDFLSDPDLYIANLETIKADSSQVTSPPDHYDGAHEHEDNIKKTIGEDNLNDSGLLHDHNIDHSESPSIVRFVGKFHPMLTHFPIALVFAAFLFSIIGAALRIQTMELVSVYCIYLAAAAGIGTVLLGLAAGTGVTYPSFLTEYFSWHRLLGITTGIITILTAFVGKRLLKRSSNRTAWLYRILLIVNAILVGVTGHFGAVLVFGPDHFSF